MEIEQVFKVGISVLNIGTGWQFYYAKMRKDGRVRVPKLALSVLQDDKPSLTGYVVEVTLEPT